MIIILAAAQLDVDGDGFLSAEELQRGLRDCDIFANVEDICQLMEENVSDVPGRDVHERHLISAQNFHVRHSVQLSTPALCPFCTTTHCELLH